MREFRIKKSLTGVSIPYDAPPALIEKIKERIMAGLPVDPRYKLVLEKLTDPEKISNPEVKKILLDEMEALRKSPDPTIVRYLELLETNPKAAEHFASLIIHLQSTDIELRDKIQSLRLSSENIGMQNPKVAELDYLEFHLVDNKDIMMIDLDVRFINNLSLKLVNFLITIYSFKADKQTIFNSLNIENKGQYEYIFKYLKHPPPQDCLFQLKVLQSDPEPPRYVPAIVESVVYRRKVFSDIKNIVEKKELVIITGIAGSGKTQLARSYIKYITEQEGLEYNKSLKNKFPLYPIDSKFNIFEFNAKSQSEFEASLRKFILDNNLNIENKKLDALDYRWLFQFISKYYPFIKRVPFLILIDNLDDKTLYDKVLNLLKEHESFIKLYGTLIITSQIYHPPTLTFEIIKYSNIELNGGMSIEECFDILDLNERVGFDAIQLFKDELPEYAMYNNNIKMIIEEISKRIDRVDSDLDSTRSLKRSKRLKLLDLLKLIKEFSNLPFGLRVASKYIKSSDSTVKLFLENYFQQYESASANKLLIEHLKSLFIGQDQYFKANLCHITTITMVLSKKDQFKKNLDMFSISSLNLIKMLSFFSPGDISELIIAEILRHHVSKYNQQDKLKHECVNAFTYFKFLLLEVSLLAFDKTKDSSTVQSESLEDVRYLSFHDITMRAAHLLISSEEKKQFSETVWRIIDDFTRNKKYKINIIHNTLLSHLPSILSKSGLKNDNDTTIVNLFSGISAESKKNIQELLFAILNSVYEATLSFYYFQAIDAYLGIDNTDTIHNPNLRMLEKLCLYSSALITCLQCAVANHISEFIERLSDKANKLYTNANLFKKNVEKHSSFYLMLETHRVIYYLIIQKDMQAVKYHNFEIANDKRSSLVTPYSMRLYQFMHACLLILNRDGQKALNLYTHLKQDYDVENNLLLHVDKIIIYFANTNYQQVIEDFEKIKVKIDTARYTFAHKYYIELYYIYFFSLILNNTLDEAKFLDILNKVKQINYSVNVSWRFWDLNIIPVVGFLYFEKSDKFNLLSDNIRNNLIKDIIILLEEKFKLRIVDIKTISYLLGFFYTKNRRYKEALEHYNNYKKIYDRESGIFVINIEDVFSSNDVKRDYMFLSRAAITAALEKLNFYGNINICHENMLEASKEQDEYNTYFYLIFNKLEFTNELSVNNIKDLLFFIPKLLAPVSCIQNRLLKFKFRETNLSKIVSGVLYYKLSEIDSVNSNDHKKRALSYLFSFDISIFNYDYQSLISEIINECISSNEDIVKLLQIYNNIYKKIFDTEFYTSFNWIPYIDLLIKNSYLIGLNNENSNYLEYLDKLIILLVLSPRHPRYIEYLNKYEDEFSQLSEIYLERSIILIKNRHHYSCLKTTKSMLILMNLYLLDNNPRSADEVKSEYLASPQYQENDKFNEIQLKISTSFLETCETILQKIMNLEASLQLQYSKATVSDLSLNCYKYANKKYLSITNNESYSLEDIITFLIKSLTYVDNFSAYLLLIYILIDLKNYHSARKYLNKSVAFAQGIKDNVDHKLIQAWLLCIDGNETTYIESEKIYISIQSTSKEEQPLAELGKIRINVKKLKELIMSSPVEIKPYHINMLTVISMQIKSFCQKHKSYIKYYYQCIYYVAKVNYLIAKITNIASDDYDFFSKALRYYNEYYSNRNTQQFSYKNEIRAIKCVRFIQAIKIKFDIPAREFKRVYSKLPSLIDLQSLDITKVRNYLINAAYRYIDYHKLNKITEQSTFNLTSNLFHGETGIQKCLEFIALLRQADSIAQIHRIYSRLNADVGYKELLNIDQEFTLKKFIERAYNTIVNTSEYFSDPQSKTTQIIYNSLILSDAKNLDVDKVRNALINAAQNYISYHSRDNSTNSQGWGVSTMLSSFNNHKTGIIRANHLIKNLLKSYSLNEVLETYRSFMEEKGYMEMAKLKISKPLKDYIKEEFAKIVENPSLYSIDESYSKRYSDSLQSDNVNLMASIFI